jgi:hypothetical protein
MGQRNQWLRSIRGAALIALFIFGAMTAVHAEIIFVDNLDDAIPAPQGSLRQAMQRSEINPGPDQIRFLIDGGTILLVAPLPDMTDGGLSFGERADLGIPPGNAIIISGQGLVSRAVRIASSANTITELDFIDFAGSEVILVGSGPDERPVGNTIANCVFGSGITGEANSGAAIRIAASGAGLPSRTKIFNNRFEGNDFGIVIDGDGNPAVVDQWTWVKGNGFGTASDGTAGNGTGRALTADGAGRVHIDDNRFSGPGTGIRLGAGSDQSRIVDNLFGVRNSSGVACSAPSGPAVEVLGSKSVVIRNNRIHCGEIGIRLGSGALQAELRSNRIVDLADDAVRLRGARQTLIRRNSITDNAGFAVSQGPNGAVEPSEATQLICNGITGNVAGGFDLPGVLTLPPVLIDATPIDVTANHLNLDNGWAELFADEVDQAATFQGALRVAPDGIDFVQQIPVVDLRVNHVPGGAEISFDRSVPMMHTATFTEEDAGQTSELSVPISADKNGLVFDVIRGNLENLTFGIAGGIILGDVDCLQNSLDPEPTVNPGPIDPVLPAPGHGFFYLARKRIAGAVSGAGNYDPAICLSDVDRYSGPREPVGGDCPQP